jgi:hypothetical protein
VYSDSERTGASRAYVSFIAISAIGGSSAWPGAVLYRTVRMDRRPEWIIGIDRYAGPPERRPMSVRLWQQRQKIRRQFLKPNPSRRRIRGDTPTRR